MVPAARSVSTSSTVPRPAENRSHSAGIWPQEDLSTCLEYEGTGEECAADAARHALDALQDYIAEATHDPWPGQRTMPEPHAQVRDSTLYLWYGPADDVVLACEPLPLADLVRRLGSPGRSQAKTAAVRNTGLDFLIRREEPGRHELPDQVGSATGTGGRSCGRRPARRPQRTRRLERTGRWCCPPPTPPAPPSGRPFLRRRCRPYRPAGPAPAAAGRQGPRCEPAYGSRRRARGGARAARRAGARPRARRRRWTRSRPPGCRRPGCRGGEASAGVAVQLGAAAEVDEVAGQLAEQQRLVDGGRAHGQHPDRLVLYFPAVAVRAVHHAVPPVPGQPGDLGQDVAKPGRDQQTARPHGGAVGQGDREAEVASADGTAGAAEVTSPVTTRPP